MMRRREFLLAGSAALATMALPTLARGAAPAAGAGKPRLLGNESAPKRLLIWGSYTCPFTALLLSVLGGIVRDMPEQASLEWHHFPAHAPDPALHVAGLSFEGQQFWNFTYAVLAFVYQANGDFNALTPEKVLEFATAQGGTAASLQAAYDDKSKWETVKEDRLAGRLLGVSKTPGLFFNGYFLTPDGIPMDLKAFDQSLRNMLKAKA